ncbi:MAG TPA: hypothetical protein VD816_02795 [Ohtaekwangia sp.]|nr:hypothetical protein [Ohtaekwangia sp.]
MADTREVGSGDNGVGSMDEQKNKAGEKAGGENPPRVISKRIYALGSEDLPLDIYPVQRDPGYTISGKVA